MEGGTKMFGTDNCRTGRETRKETTIAEEKRYAA